MKKIYNIFKIELPEKRNFGLDLLRFLAIFTVLVSHAITILPPNFEFAQLLITDGVLIFFVLSGFLIGRILIRDFEEGISRKKMLYFWKRRWFRTLPAYFFAIFLVLALSYISHSHFNKFEVLKTIFFIQNITHEPRSFFIESWSLSIEEWFYLTLPILIYLFYKIFNISIKTNILLLFVLILIWSIAIRTYYYFNLNIDTVTIWDNRFRKPVITRLDSILIGVLGAWFYIYKKDYFRNNKKIFFITGLLVFFINKFYFDYFLTEFGFYSSVVYFSLIPFSVLLMIPYLYYLKPSSFKIFNDIITYGSLTSYSLYLLNSTIIIGLILNPMVSDSTLKFLLFWVLNTLLSIVMYKYIELPFMRLRDKPKSIKEQ